MQPSSDAEIVQQIDALIAEEREILHRAPDGLDADDSERVRALHVERDRLWDLKRERQAMRDAGRDPAEAVERSGEVVERYLQ